MKTLEQIREENARLRAEIDRLALGATSGVKAPYSADNIDAVLSERAELMKLGAGLLSSGDAFDRLPELRIATEQLRLRIADLRGQVSAAGKTPPQMPVDGGNCFGFYNDLLAHEANLHRMLGGMGSPTASAPTAPARALTPKQQADSIALHKELGELQEAAKGAKGLTKLHYQCRIDGLRKKLAEL